MIALNVWLLCVTSTNFACAIRVLTIHTVDDKTEEDASAGSGGVAHTTETIPGECACIYSFMYVYVFVPLCDLFLYLLACVCAQATVPLGLTRTGMEGG